MAREIHRLETSFVREAVDPDNKLPEVVLVPDIRPSFHVITDNYLLIDATHGGAGQATIVRAPNARRYFTRLEVTDRHLDREVRLAAYLLAIEDTTLGHGEIFMNDPFAEHERDVEVWEALAREGVAQIPEEFQPRRNNSRQGASELFVGIAYVEPPIPTLRG
ncbi:MAG: hypothetical protein JWP13_756 [Candidatus Saccharibacteria bacterium]|nr:hypothetical protein [Candidatus Saccharibacteria bacterium]